jgi:hypothetical protein
MSSRNVCNDAETYKNIFRQICTENNFNTYKDNLIKNYRSDDTYTWLCDEVKSDVNGWRDLELAIHSTQDYGESSSDNISYYIKSINCGNIIAMIYYSRYKYISNYSKSYFNFIDDEINILIKYLDAGVVINNKIAMQYRSYIAAEYELNFELAMTLRKKMLHTDSNEIAATAINYSRGILVSRNIDTAIQLYSQEYNEINKHNNCMNDLYIFNKVRKDVDFLLDQGYLYNAALLITGVMDFLDEPDVFDNDFFSNYPAADFMSALVDKIKSQNLLISQQAQEIAELKALKVLTGGDVMFKIGSDYLSNDKTDEIKTNGK